MEGSSWCPEAVDSSSDWRKQLLPEARQRIVNKIVHTLKRHLPVSSPEGLNELKKIAERFEEKIYIAAINLSDYLRKISLKMLSLETKTQGAAVINPSLSNPTIGNQSPSESVNSTIQMGTADAVAVNSTIQTGPVHTVAVNSTTQTGHADTVDWQEEVYQKVKSLKELYLAEISELHQKISLKIQQLPQSEALGSPAKQSEQFEKLKQFKLMLERTMMFLQLSKNNIQLNMKDRIPMYEKQIMSFVSSNRNKKVAPSQQQGQPQFPHPSGHSMPQQQPSQVPQLQPHDNLLNQSQLMNLQGSVSSMQNSSSSSMQQGSVPLTAHVTVPATQQNMAIAQQPQTMDPMQGSSFSSLQQGAMGSMQQGDLGLLQNTITAPQQSSNALQQQQLQQQQQEQQNQLKQLQQRQMQQLYQQQQKQLMLQLAPMQQQLHQQKQQQTSQVPVHQLPQLHQMNDVRQGPGIKPGIYQQHYSGSQRHNYYQQKKPGTSFPISSPQNPQASSPQISQSSLQIDQHNLLLPPKTGTLTNSPFVVPSPSSTPIPPSPLSGDPEKPSGVSTLPNTVGAGYQQQSNLASSQTQSLAVGTPGISASPLLAEFTSPDGSQVNPSAVVPRKSSTTEDPLDCLIKTVKSMKEIYYDQICELQQRTNLKIQQLTQMNAPSEQLEKQKQFAQTLERTKMFLQTTKDNIPPLLIDQLTLCEKQIASFVAPNWITKLEGQQFQHQPSQISTTSMQEGSTPLSINATVSATQPNIAIALQPPSLGPIQGNSFSSLQLGAIGPMQNGGFGSLENAYQPYMFNGFGSLQNYSSANHQRSIELQREQQRLMQMQLWSQQQFQIQQKQQVPVQMNGASKGFGSGLHQPYFPGVSQQNYYQSPKPSSLFPIASQQNLETAPPQSSAQVDRHAVGTPSQPASSAIVSPRFMPIALSPTEKHSGTSKSVSISETESRVVTADQVAALDNRVAALKNRVVSLEKSMSVILCAIFFALFVGSYILW